jgi:hypothetical protein
MPPGACALRRLFRARVTTFGRFARRNRTGPAANGASASLAAHSSAILAFLLDMIWPRMTKAPNVAPNDGPAPAFPAS